LFNKQFDNIFTVNYANLPLSSFSGFLPLFFETMSPAAFLIYAEASMITSVVFIYYWEDS
ncbi:hypothetical protein KAI31_04805, partial [Candidatus Bathyarchaeota archaeon]|nr:hypothetical protein [Candidatus Bathyarchaeota archaeon]